MTPETTARPSCRLIHTNHPLQEGTSGSCGHHQPAFGGRARPGRSFHGPYSGHILDFNPLVSTGLLTSIWTGQRRLLWDFGLYSPSSGVTRSLDSGLHFDIFKFPFHRFLQSVLNLWGSRNCQRYSPVQKPDLPLVRPRMSCNSGLQASISLEVSCGLLPARYCKICFFD